MRADLKERASDAALSPPLMQHPSCLFLAAPASHGTECRAMRAERDRNCSLGRAPTREKKAAAESAGMITWSGSSSSAASASSTSMQLFSFPTESKHLGWSCTVLSSTFSCAFGAANPDTRKRHEAATRKAIQRKNRRSHEHLRQKSAKRSYKSVARRTCAHLHSPSTINLYWWIPGTI